MPTMTRGAVTIAPVDLRGWRTTRPGQTVVHDILGDPTPDITLRAPGSRRSPVALAFAEYAEAEEAAAALAVPGGAWVLVPFPGESITVQIGDDIGVESSSDEAPAVWLVTFTAIEVTA